MNKNFGLVGLHHMLSYYAKRSNRPIPFASAAKLLTTILLTNNVRTMQITPFKQFLPNSTNKQHLMNQHHTQEN